MILELFFWETQAGSLQRGTSHVTSWWKTYQQAAFCLCNCLINVLISYGLRYLFNPSLDHCNQHSLWHNLCPSSVLWVLLLTQCSLVTLGSSKEKDELPCVGLRIWGQTLSLREFLALQLTTLEWCLIPKCKATRIFVPCWTDVTRNLEDLPLSGEGYKVMLFSCVSRVSEAGGRDFLVACGLVCHWYQEINRATRWLVTTESSPCQYAVPFEARTIWNNLHGPS